MKEQELPFYVKQNKPLKVLVACESSGAVRDAFNKLGHVATSCDLLDSEKPGRHYKGDVFDIINDGWDLMIAHPPCTYMCSSGMHWTVRGLRDPQLTEDALAFVQKLMDANIPMIAIENPVGAISTRIRKATQYIQPYEFGHDASKKTGLWLKGLRMLEGTAYVAPRYVDGRPRWGNQCDNGQNKLGPSEDRWKERSKTYAGIAAAMANQWGRETGWREVSFACCNLGAEEGEEEFGDICSICGDDYSECACPGPTMDEYEYQEFHGVMMARAICN